MNFSHTFLPISDSPEATHQLGIALGKQLRAGDVVFLEGELGAGKTTFTQGIAAAWGIAAAPSPTYVLIIEHAAKIPLLHLDAYRLEGACFDALRDAGIEDFFNRDDAIKIVEWPQFVRDWTPAPHDATHYYVHMAHGENEDRRHIEIKSSAEIDRTPL